MLDVSRFQQFCVALQLNFSSISPQQRDSGDEEDMEKNSEDEEGQLEEQIEKLQEKVESAQSEQKNLFLVIFQVRVHYFACSRHKCLLVFSCHRYFKRRGAADGGKVPFLQLVPVCQKRINIPFMRLSACLCVPL